MTAKEDALMALLAADKEMTDDNWDAIKEIATEALQREQREREYQQRQRIQIVASEKLRQLEEGERLQRKWAIESVEEMDRDIFKALDQAVGTGRPGG